MAAEDDSWLRYAATLSVLERIAGHPMRPAGAHLVPRMQTPDGQRSFPTEPLILEMEIEQRLTQLGPLDRFEVEDALEGLTLQGKYDLVELFFAED